MTLTSRHFCISFFTTSVMIGLRNLYCSTVGLCPSKRIMCMQTFGQRPRILAMVHPIDNLCFLKILCNFSSCKGVNEAKPITGRKIEFRRNSYLKCFGKCFNSNFGVQIANIIFTLFSVLCIDKGSTWTQSLVIIGCAFNNHTTSASSSSSSIESTGTKACSKWYDKWCFA